MRSVSSSIRSCSVAIALVSPGIRAGGSNAMGRIRLSRPSAGLAEERLDGPEYNG